jgi:hypothetical protein
MKKIMMSFAFLLAIGGALVTQANSAKFTTRFQQANPNNKAATCVPINCIDTGTPACTVVITGYTTYKSTGTQPDCNTVTVLHDIP